VQDLEIARRVDAPDPIRLSSRRLWANCSSVLRCVVLLEFLQQRDQLMHACVRLLCTRFEQSRRTFRRARAAFDSKTWLVQWYSTALIVARPERRSRSSASGQDDPHRKYFPL